MDKICVATADSTAYYQILSQLKQTGFRFVSMVPSEVSDEESALVITTRKESDMIGGVSVAIEDLDQNPMVMRGQLLARMVNGAKRLVVGIDPGRRMGVAAFYEDTRIGSLTLSSVEEVSDTVTHIIKATPNSGVTVKIGDGDIRLARELGTSLKKSLGEVLVEIVDESGTSLGGIRKGLTRDQSSATRIAFRKGVPVT